MRKIPHWWLIVLTITTIVLTSAYWSSVKSHERSNLSSTDQVRDKIYLPGIPLPPKPVADMTDDELAAWKKQCEHYMRKD